MLKLLRNFGRTVGVILTTVGLISFREEFARVLVILHLNPDTGRIILIAGGVLIFLLFQFGSPVFKRFQNDPDDADDSVTFDIGRVGRADIEDSSFQGVKRVFRSKSIDSLRWSN